MPSQADVDAALRPHPHGGYLRLYIAFPIERRGDDGHAVATKVGSVNISNNVDVLEVKQEWFGNYGWVTLCGSKEDAIKEAVASNGRAALYAAMQDTDWLVLEVTFSPPQAAACYHDKLLSQSTDYGLDCYRSFTIQPSSTILPCHPP